MGQIKVNISLNDSASLGNINISDSMELDVGDVVQTGSYKIVPGDGFNPIGWDTATADPPYNETGAFCFIKNTFNY